MEEKDVASLLTNQECAICLNSTSSSPCCLDGCFHSYCLSCISEWAKIGGCICPLCKRDFKRVIYNVKSDKLFRTRRLDQPNSLGSPLDVAAGECAFRRSLYDRGLAGHPIPSSNLFLLETRKNLYPTAAQLQRLRPWLFRELQALTEDWHPDLLVRIVEGVVAKLGLDKALLREALKEFFFDHTEALVDELIFFFLLNRPMPQFDLLASYKSPPSSSPVRSVFSLPSSSSSLSSSSSSPLLSSSSSPSSALSSAPPSLFLADEPEPTTLREWKAWVAKQDGFPEHQVIDDDVQCLGGSSLRKKRVVIDLDVVEVSSSDDEEAMSSHSADSTSRKRPKTAVINLVDGDVDPHARDSSHCTEHKVNGSSTTHGEASSCDVVEVFSDLDNDVVYNDVVEVVSDNDVVYSEDEVEFWDRNNHREDQLVCT